MCRLVAPSVTFNTLTPEGWLPNKYPWIELNGQKLRAHPIRQLLLGECQVRVVVLDGNATREDRCAGVIAQCFDSQGAYDAWPSPANDLVIAARYRTSR